MTRVQANLILLLAAAIWGGGFVAQSTAMETIETLQGVRAAFYAPRTISSFLRRQLLQDKNAFMAWSEMGGQRVMTFGEVPFRRTDALNVEETEVV